MNDTEVNGTSLNETKVNNMEFIKADCVCGGMLLK